MRLEFVQNGVAIHIRHHYIEQDEVGRRMALSDLQGATPVVGGANAVGGMQQLTQDGQVLGCVVDNQDGELAVRHAVPTI